MNRNARPRLTIRNYSKRRSTSIFSKSIVQILLWQILIWAIYTFALIEVPHAIKIPNVYDWSHIMRSVIIQVLYLVYPLGVIVGDVCLGRYKTIILSLFIVTVSLLSSSIGGVLLFVRDGTAKKIDSLNLFKDKLDEFGKNGFETASLVFFILSAPIFILGFSIYNSTVVQFGLDQLIDKPSESLGVFTHWLVWALQVGEVLIEFFYIVQKCISTETTYIVKIMNQSLPICFFVLFVIMLLVSWCTRHRLNHDSVLYNPYKMIYNVFRFAYKNKHSLNLVATYGHDKLTRIDKAKQCFGGPFKNSNVEDIKHFKRILFLLFALGPVFVLFLPVNAYFTDFTQHTGYSVYIESLNKTCADLSPQFFSDALSVFTLPIYIWVMYACLQNRRPNILYRLVLLVLLYILVAASMLVIDTAGHLNLYTHRDSQPRCMFTTNKFNATQSLDMHWSVLIFPAAFNGIFYLQLATALEFIAAQSPHAMRGVLLGAFYFIVGIFRVLSVLLFIPFGINSIWDDGYLGDHPPVISCGFGYYSACIVIAVIGFVALLFAVRWYQYRRRDELTLQPTKSSRREDYQQLKD